MSAAGFWSRPKIRKWTEYTVTTVFWIMWFYLILPIISLALWMAGYQLFVDEMLVHGGYASLLAELRNYGIVILSMSAIMVIWIKWNQRHYGLHNKRTHQPSAVTGPEQAEGAGLTLDQLVQLQGSRHVIADFDENDQLMIHGLTRPKN